MAAPLKLAAVTCVLALAALASLWTFLPIAICAVVPERCGLVAIAPGLHVDARAGDAERRRIAALHERGREIVENRLGPFERPPRAWVCTTERCHERLGGTGARAIAYGGLGARVSPRGVTPAILAHELAHVRIGELVGTVPVLLERMPAWLNEGLAVLVSDDPRYLGPDGACAPGSTGLAALPRTTRAWIARASREGGRPLYAAAACAARGWVERGGGWGAVPRRLRARDWTAGAAGRSSGDGQ